MGWKELIQGYQEKGEKDRSTTYHPHWGNVGGICKIFQTHQVLQATSQL